MPSSAASCGHFARSLSVSTSDAGSTPTTIEGRLVASSTSTYRFPAITAAAKADPSPALVVPVGPRADALRNAIIAAGSIARERRIKDLVLFTGISPGLAPTEAVVMDGALQPAPLVPP